MKLRTLRIIYEQLNAKNFGGVLVQPRILARRWNDAIGQFCFGDNMQSRMEFNPTHITGMSHARAIVYHEMIHQYVEEYLGLYESEHHGNIFWKNYRKFATPGIELGVKL